MAKWLLHREYMGTSICYEGIFQFAEKIREVNILGSGKLMRNVPWRFKPEIQEPKFWWCCEDGERQTNWR